MCGEKYLRIAVFVLLLGSPPHVRGKASFFGCSRPGDGITPAYAGKRFPTAALFRSSRDHPRVCGEKGWDYDAFLYQLGSPPRMRGKVDNVRCGQTYPGITPAYAGKRSTTQIFRHLYRDHPRVCGEKVFLSVPATSVLGSPPRMRGKVTPVSLVALWGRITPAYAGKRAVVPVYDVRFRDHPRVCGEKTDSQYQLPIMQGSPPRMRGKGVKWQVSRRLKWITPAYAGKSGLAALAAIDCRDHPRVCGEKPAGLQFLIRWMGSPPRMRGKEQPAIDDYNAVRITPAYAGKSGVQCCSIRRKWDHPRVCGEKLSEMFFAFLLIGSPPRMRGKVQKFIKAGFGWRITPAYAGKSGWWG